MHYDAFGGATINGLYYPQSEMARMNMPQPLYYAAPQRPAQQTGLFVPSYNPCPGSAPPPATLVPKRKRVTPVVMPGPAIPVAAPKPATPVAAPTTPSVPFSSAVGELLFETNDPKPLRRAVINGTIGERLARPLCTFPTCKMVSFNMRYGCMSLEFLYALLAAILNAILYGTIVMLQEFPLCVNALRQFHTPEDLGEALEVIRAIAKLSTPAANGITTNPKGDGISGLLTIFPEGYEVEALSCPYRSLGLEWESVRFAPPVMVTPPGEAPFALINVHLKQDVEHWTNLLHYVISPLSANPTNYGLLPGSSITVAGDFNRTPSKIQSELASTTFSETSPYTWELAHTLERAEGRRAIDNFAIFSRQKTGATGKLWAGLSFGTGSDHTACLLNPTQYRR